MMSGVGINIGKDGNRYEGEFVMDKKSGFGYFYWGEG